MNSAWFSGSEETCTGVGGAGGTSSRLMYLLRLADSRTSGGGNARRCAFHASSSQYRLMMYPGRIMMKNVKRQLTCFNFTLSNLLPSCNNFPVNPDSPKHHASESAMLATRNAHPMMRYCVVIIVKPISYEINVLRYARSYEVSTSKRTRIVVFFDAPVYT
jgi:hypothetical protein